MRAKRRLATAVLAAAIFATAALGVELAARAMTRTLGKCHPVCLVEYDATLGWNNTPHAVGRHLQPAIGIDVVYRIDARGTRTGAEPAVPDAPRVVVLGDSNGFGWGVGEDRHFAALLARSGAANVLNLSVSGYGTDQALLRFLAEGRAFRPQVVVVQVTPNDFDDIRATLRGGRPKPRFTLDGPMPVLRNVPVTVLAEDAQHLVGEPVLLLPVRTWLARHSWFYAWLNERTAPRERAAHADRRFSPDTVSLFRALVEAIREAAAAQGAAVVLLHASAELGERRTAAIPAGVEVLDLTERFASAAPALFADDLHWNERGHRIVAERLAAWLAEHAPQPSPGGREREPSSRR